MSAIYERFGSVLFDENGGKAWACINGGEVKRIEAIGQLDKDVFWWTNLNKDKFQSIGIGSHVNLKETDYIRPNAKMFLQEYGLIEDSEEQTEADIKRNIKVLSEVFARVMRLTIAMYGIPDFSASSYNGAMYHKIIPEEKHNSKEFNDILTKAYETYKSCDTLHDKERIMFTVRRSRIEHALDILSTPIPDNNWEFIPGDKLPPMEDRKKWLLSTNRPYLANVVVTNINQNVAPILAFGKVGHKTFRARDWVSAREFETLQKYASVEIKNIYLGGAYTTVPMDNPMLTLGDFGLLSTSLGIVCENYLGTMISNRITYEYDPSKAASRFTPRSVWLSAADRNLMFEMALFLHNEGYFVRGYGKGFIKVEVERDSDRINYFKAVCRQIGLSIGLDKRKELNN